MSLLMTIDSSFFRVSTNMGTHPLNHRHSVALWFPLSQTPHRRAISGPSNGKVYSWSLIWRKGENPPKVLRIRVFEPLTSVAPRGFCYVSRENRLADRFIQSPTPDHSSSNINKILAPTVGNRDESTPAGVCCGANPWPAAPKFAAAHPCVSSRFAATPRSNLSAWAGKDFGWDHIEKRHWISFCAAISQMAKAAGVLKLNARLHWSHPTSFAYASVSKCFENLKNKMESKKRKLNDVTKNDSVSYNSNTKSY